jgi:mono/diheme cytochrome c family protein
VNKRYLIRGITSGAVLATALVLGACASRAADRQTADSLPESGERIYRVSCAACHGIDARGAGPVSPLLNVEVPDLTRIAARRDGAFPELEIYRIIDGQAQLQAHGARHMPVWGYEFFGDETDDETAHARAVGKIDSLVEYLRSIQRSSD